MDIKTILFPTDFSDTAKNALSYLLNFSIKSGSELILFHAYQMPMPAAGVPLIGQVQVAENFQIEAVTNMEKLKTEVARVNPGIKVRTLIKEGYMRILLPKIVKGENVDLVVMGTSGASYLESLLMGTNSAEAIERVNCPVLVIPKTYTFKPIKEIVFSSEYLDSDIEILKFCKWLAALYGANITVLNIFYQYESVEIEKVSTNMFEEMVWKEMANPEIKFICIKAEKKQKTLMDYLETNPIDLLVMSSRHRNLIEKLYDRSLTKRMAYRVNIPLLAFHSEET